MTIFARRRIQSMLDELAPSFTGSKGVDVLNRLNNEEKVDDALPTEMELALTWAVSSLGPLEIEPAWWEGRTPDIVTETLITGVTTAIEIYAPNDNSIAGEEAMDAIALQIMAAADSEKKGCGDYLYFRFGEERFHVNRTYVRRRLAPRNFKLPEDISAAVRDWIRSGQSQEKRLRLQAPSANTKEPSLDVEVEHTTSKQVRYHNVWSTMPAETHSVEDNPLFKHLRTKKRKFRNAEPGTLRLIFVADVGSTLLRYIGSVGELDPTNHRVSGREILAHFVHKYACDVDAVVGFSPYKDTRIIGDRDSFGRKARGWNISYFGSPALPNAPEALNRIAEILPTPHYEGYQARSLFKQGAFSPMGTGQYLDMGARVNMQKNEYSIKFPMRILLDLLAGRISEEWFRNYLWRRKEDVNLFELWLNMGMTIRNVEMAPRDLDEDDDHVIFHFSDDPAARPFTLSER